VKIRSVVSDSRRRAFLVTTRRGVHEFPWAVLEVRPTPKDPVVDAAPDPELGREGFTYRLASGAEGTVHIDHVLRQCRDPDYERVELIQALTVEALRTIRSGGRTKRGLARQLGTSLSQLARLLDPTNTKKSVDQMLRLLAALGRRVDFRVSAAKAVPA
jgi:hypothetical protein